MVQPLTCILVGTKMEKIQANLNQTTKQTNEQSSAQTATKKNNKKKKVTIESQPDNQKMQTEKQPAVSCKKDAVVSVPKALTKAKQANAEDLEIQNLIQSKLCMALADALSNQIKPVEQSYWPAIETKVRAFIMQRLLNTNSSIPRFQTAGIYRGFLLIKCNDEHSKITFCQSVSAICRIIQGKCLTAIRASRINRILERNLTGNVEPKDVKKPPTQVSTKDAGQCKTSSGREQTMPKNIASNIIQNKEANCNKKDCILDKKLTGKVEPKDVKKPPTQVSTKDAGQCKTSSGREQTMPKNIASNIIQNKEANCNKKANDFGQKDLNLSEQRTALQSSLNNLYETGAEFGREITKVHYEKCKSYLLHLASIENLNRNQRHKQRKAQKITKAYEQMHGICNEEVTAFHRDSVPFENVFGESSWNCGGNEMQIADHFRETSDRFHRYFNSELEQQPFASNISNSFQNCYNPRNESDSRMMANRYFEPEMESMPTILSNCESNYLNSRANFPSDFNPFPGPSGATDYVHPEMDRLSQMHNFGSNADTFNISNRNFLPNSPRLGFSLNSSSSFDFDSPISKDYGERNDEYFNETDVQNFALNAESFNSPGRQYPSNSPKPRFSLNLRNSFDFEEQHMDASSRNLSNYGIQSEKYFEETHGHSSGERPRFTSNYESVYQPEMRRVSSRSSFDFERDQMTQTVRNLKNYDDPNEVRFNEPDTHDFSANPGSSNISGRCYPSNSSRSGFPLNCWNSFDIEGEHRDETAQNSKDYDMQIRKYFNEENLRSTSNCGNVYRTEMKESSFREGEQMHKTSRAWENHDAVQEERFSNKRRRLSSNYENLFQPATQNSSKPSCNETQANSELTPTSERYFKTFSQQESNKPNDQRPNTSTKNVSETRIYECLSFFNEETGNKTHQNSGRDLERFRPTEPQVDETSPLTKLKRKSEILRKNKPVQPAADVIVLSDDDDDDVEKVATFDVKKARNEYFKALDYLNKMKSCKRNSLSDAEKLQIEICQHKIHKYGKILGDPKVNSISKNAHTSNSRCTAKRSRCDPPPASTLQATTNPAHKTQDQQKKQPGLWKAGSDCVAPNRTDFFISTFKSQNSSIPNNLKSSALPQDPAPSNACTTGKPKTDLRIAIIDRNQENFKIPPEAWQKIKKSLLEQLCQELQQTNNPKIGMFDGAYWEYGIKIIQCENVESLNFIKRFIHRQHIFWPNTQFDAIPAGELPKRSMVNVWIPPPLIDDSAALKLLKAQNSMFFSNDWTLINSHENERGKSMYISISSTSVERLRKKNFEIRYGTNRLKMNLPE